MSSSQTSRGGPVPFDIKLIDTVDLKPFLASEPFRRYVKQAGILGLEQSLLRAYLLYMLNVIKPTEGLEQTRELLNAVSQPLKQA